MSEENRRKRGRESQRLQVTRVFFITDPNIPSQEAIPGETGFAPRSSSVTQGQQACFYTNDKLEFRDPDMMKPEMRLSFNKFDTFFIICYCLHHSYLSPYFASLARLREDRKEGRRKANDR
jgi:hypothetical protein